MFHGRMNNLVFEYQTSQYTPTNAAAFQVYMWLLRLWLSELWNRWIPTFRKNIFLPTSGLKYVGWGIGYVIKADFKNWSLRQLWLSELWNRWIPTFRKNIFLPTSGLKYVRRGIGYVIKADCKKLVSDPQKEMGPGPESAVLLSIPHPVPSEWPPSSQHVFINQLSPSPTHFSPASWAASSSETSRRLNGMYK
jgi:hypothetical protein